MKTKLNVKISKKIPVWHIPAIFVVGTWMQDLKFKVSLGYTATPSLKKVFFNVNISLKHI